MGAHSCFTPQLRPPASGSSHRLPRANWRSRKAVLQLTASASVSSQRSHPQTRCTSLPGLALPAPLEQQVSHRERTRARDILLTHAPRTRHFARGSRTRWPAPTETGAGEGDGPARSCVPSAGPGEDGGKITPGWVMTPGPRSRTLEIASAANCVGRPGTPQPRRHNGRRETWQVNRPRPRTRRRSR